MPDEWERWDWGAVSCFLQVQHLIFLFYFDIVQYVKLSSVAKSFASLALLYQVACDIVWLHNTFSRGKSFSERGLC